MKLLRLLKSLLRLGKKNDEDLVAELIKINGVGEEYATRLAKVYGSMKALRKAKLSDLKVWLRDDVAWEVYETVRK